MTTDPRGTAYRICDGSDVPIPVRPELPAADPASAPALVARLAHLARFLAVRALDNPDPLSPLRGKLVVELLQAPAGFQKGDPTAGLKPFPAGTVPRLAPGTWLVLQVTNRAAQPVNVVVLDLSSDWSVSVAHPDDRFLTVAPGEEPLRLPLRGVLPDGQTSGRDTLKVVATVDPPPGFELLALPPLDRPIPPAAGRTRSAGPLGDLLAAVAADRPTRALTTGAVPGRGWAVGHAEVEVG